MAKNTSGAVHLTSLDLDISQIQQDIQTVNQDIEQLANSAVENGERIKNSLSGINISGTDFSSKSSGGKSRNKSSQKEEQEEIKVTVKQLESLANAYANLEKRLATAKLIPNTEEFKSAADDIKRFSDELYSYTKQVKDDSDINKTMSGTILEAANSLKNLSTELTRSSTVAIESGKGYQTAADKVRDLNSTVKQFSSEGLKFQNLLTSLEKHTKFDENFDSFNKLKEQVAGYVDKLNALYNEISSKGTVEKEQYNRLVEISKQYNVLKKTLSELEATAAKTGEGLKKVVDVPSVDASQLEKLALSYSSFLAQLSSPSLKDDQNKTIEKLSIGAKEAENALLSLANQMRAGDNVSKEAADSLEKYSKELVTSRTEFNHFKESSNTFIGSLKDVKQNVSDAIDEIKKLGKSAVFSSTKKEVSDLQSEFEQLKKDIDRGNISAKEADRIYDDLSTRFKTLKGTISRSNTTLENWVNKISESAKWQIANKVLNTMQEAFSNVTTTIIDTENATIELQRVLDDAPAGSVISDRLYDIAYRFGQEFENVQEVAVKFAQTGLEWNDVLSATEATMLGLNTAELEVSTATEGLIAVMAQFNIEASDLEAVIDKINITADSFPVTSEKIVAALQRAGGTASAFGLTLEETIGIITALSEATGRAGSNIGTALNSLISFSMKDTALEKFSEFLGQDVSNFGVLKLWQELSAEIEKGNDSLATMMSQSEEFSSLMDETLATSIGLEEEYNLALKEQNETLDAGKDIYSTVGTYRQNYFIALLNNIKTAQDAMDTMNMDALGYSMRENETAMEAFGKQWNQLVISAQELAVQFGEAGFLDLMKFFVDAGTSVLKLSKNFGGLNTVLLATATLILKVKSQKINDYFEKESTIVHTLSTAHKAYNTAIQTGATATQAFSAALGAVELSAGGVITILSAVITVSSAIAGHIKQVNEEAKQMRKDLIETGAESTRSAAKLAKDYFSFQSLSGGGFAKETIAEYDRILKEVENKQIDLTKTVYGNIDTNNRQLLEWTEENLNKFKEAYESIGYTASELKGTISTIMGSSSEYDGIEIAYTPILQTEDGPKLLDQHTVDEYIWGLIDKAGEGWTIERLFQLDTEGLEFEGQVIKNLIADIGETAIKTGEAMHYTGNLGAVALAMQEVKTYADAAGMSIEEYTEKINSGMLQSSHTTEESAIAILEQFNYQKEDIPLLIQRYGDLESAVRSLTEAQYESQKSDAQQAFQASLDSIKDLEFSNLGIISDQIERVSEIFYRPQNYEEAKKQLEIYKNELSNLESELTSSERATNGYYLSLKDWVKVLEEWIIKTDDAEYNLNLFGDTIEEFYLNISAANAIAEQALENIENAANNIPNTTVSVDDLNTSIESLQEQFETLTKRVDGFQSAFQTVKDVIKEYNETGILTADMLQTIMDLEPEYIQMLDIEGNSISLNEEKVRELMQANEEYLTQLEALKIAEQVQTLIRDIGTETTSDMTLAQIEARIETEKLTGTLETSIQSLINGTSTGEDFKEALRNIAQAAGLSGSQIDYLIEKVDSLTGSMLSLNRVAQMNRLENTTDLERRPGESDEAYQIRVDSLNKYKLEQQYKNQLKDQTKFWATSSGSSNKTSSSKKATDAETDALKAQKEALDDVIDSYEHMIFMMEKSGASAEEIAAVYRKMQEETHEQAEKYRSMGTKEAQKYADELSEIWWDYQEKIEEVLHGIYEATIESHENALSLLSEQFDWYEERNDYSHMSDNLEKQLEYQLKIQEEAHKEAQRLRELGVDENDEAIQDAISTWWEAEKSIREISAKIEESILDPYDDFIDLADQFDLWEYMDFTKVDYLRQKLDAINDLLAKGIISMKEYNQLLKETSVEIYNAQKDLLKKQQDDIQKKYNDVIKGLEKNIEGLNKQKDSIQDYYDGIIDGYNAEIDALENRKEESDKYYDSLIDSLKEVEEENDRINAQVDYYNERQKILTNLEQAQARSGVAWREKEMEYQQQLMELDEDWNRTQKEWSIEDQIEALENLKEQANQDIDDMIEKINASITAAEEASQDALDSIEAEIEAIEEQITAAEEQAEAEIAAIEEQINGLSEIIANAIKAGMEDGMIDASAEVDKAIVDGSNALLTAIDENKAVISDSAEETATATYNAFEDGFITPMESSIDEIADYMKSSIQTGSNAAATAAATSFRTSFITPIKNEIASLMKEVQNIKSSYATVGPFTNANDLTVNSSESRAKNQRYTYTTPTPSGKQMTNVYITNNNTTSDRAARTAQQILQKILR